MIKKTCEKFLNLHSVLALTIALICVLCMGLVYLSDRAYQGMAVEIQKDAYKNLLSIKSNDLVNELIKRQKEMGFILQSEQNFLDAFINRDTEKLKFWLDQEFNRYYVTTDLIKLEKLLVYDTDFRLVSRSARGVAIGERGALPCASLAMNMSQLPVTEHLKPRSELCLYDNKPLLSTIVSIGSLQPRGYIQVVSDPAYILANIEDKLGTELRIATYDNNILHQSTNWPKTPQTDESFLISNYKIPASDGSPLLVISSAVNKQDIQKKIASTSNKTIFTALFLTSSMLIIAFGIIRKVLLPLRKLREAANEIGSGGHTIAIVEGLPEVAEPARLFNKAAMRIKALTDDLEYEIETHNKTEEKLRDAVKQAEDNALTIETQRNFLRMTLKSVVDGVITTDTSGHITYINPIAEQLTGWSEEEANGKPLVQVFHALYSETRDRIYELTEEVKTRSALDEPVSAILIQEGSNVETPVEYIASPMLDNKDNISGNVIIIHDESAQRSLNRQLTFQATHDALTGLINRYEFESRLRQLISAVGRKPGTHALCHIDIDEFTSINDKLGHNAGDELLKQVTSMLEMHVQEENTLARLGGDDFCLLLKNHDIQKAESLAIKILRDIDKYNFIWDMSSIGINLSIGIVEITNDGISSDELLRNANSACCLAKEDGRKRLQIYTPENSSLLTQQREMHWVSRINHALEEERFQLYFHDILPLNDGIKSFMRNGEILLRMIDKQGELVSPDMFMPAAGRYGMLGVIDEWVVNKTIDWLSGSARNTAVSVNLSEHSIASKDFLNFVVTRIKQSRISPELLCFEITEALAIRHLSSAIHFMTVLKKLGCSFALDDFGSGLSSFSYLTSLPVDYLKIDGSFVVDIDKDPMHYAMVKSINEVGHVMGIRTVAEFAASDRIIECLREIGVDYAQGYAVSRPVPLSSYDAGRPDHSSLLAR